MESKANGKVLYTTVQDPAQMKDNATWQGFYQSGIVMEYLDGVKSLPVQADFINTKNEIDLKQTFEEDEEYGTGGDTTEGAFSTVADESEFEGYDVKDAEDMDFTDSEDEEYDEYEDGAEDDYGDGEDDM